MTKFLFYLFPFCLTSCFAPFYTKMGEKTEMELGGYQTKTVTYKRSSIRFSKNKRWPQYAMGKTKKYTYDSNGKLRKLEISKNSSYGFQWGTGKKTKRYDENGKRIRKHKE